MFACQECGRKFRNVAAARRAADRGCTCGGVDIDLDPNPTLAKRKVKKVVPNVGNNDSGEMATETCYCGLDPAQYCPSHDVTRPSSATLANSEERCPHCGISQAFPWRHCAACNCPREPLSDSMHPEGI